MAQPDLPSPEAIRLHRKLTAYIEIWLIHAMATFNLADLLDETPLRPEEIARRLELAPKRCARFLAGLVHFGLLARTEEGAYALTASGQLIGSRHPNSVKHLALLVGDEFMPAWSKMTESLRDGKPAFDHFFGRRLFEYFSADTARGRRFHHFMATIAGDLAELLVKNYSFPASGKVIDLGGGDSTLLSKVLQANPGLTGLLVDREDVLPLARQRLKSEGLTDRCTLAPGDFFQSAPEGGDCYILSQILHDWGDDEALLILRNCARAMNDGARLLILTTLLEDTPQAPSFSIISDLNMLVLTGGKERSRTQYEDLFNRAGLKLKRPIPLGETYWVLEVTGRGYKNPR